MGSELFIVYSSCIGQILATASWGVYPHARKEAEFFAVAIFRGPKIEVENEKFFWQMGGG